MNVKESLWRHKFRYVSTGMALLTPEKRYSQMFWLKKV